LRRPSRMSQTAERALDVGKRRVIFPGSALDDQATPVVLSP
jgi:hypothetical protein